MAAIRDSREIALEAAKFLGRDHDNFVASVHRHMLRSLAAHAPHQLAETRLGVLQSQWPDFRLRLRRRGFARRWIFHF